MSSELNWCNPWCTHLLLVEIVDEFHLTLFVFRNVFNWYSPGVKGMVSLVKKINKHLCMKVHLEHSTSLSLRIVVFPPCLSPSVEPRLESHTRTGALIVCWVFSPYFIACVFSSNIYFFPWLEIKLKMKLYRAPKIAQWAGRAFLKPKINTKCKKKHYEDLVSIQRP